MKTALTIIIVVSTLLLYFLNRENKQLRKQNLEYVNKIALLENEKKVCNGALYKYERSNALFFEKYRDCGVKLERIFKQIE